MRNPDDGAPIVITDAQRSYEEELATRKRRYGIMMGMRVPCLVLAAVFYQTPWLAAALIVLSIPLPWMAVIIANDRLPRRATEFQRHREDADALESTRYRAIESGDHQVIDPPDGR